MSVNFLSGDTNGDRFVNAGDTTRTRSRSGQATDATNFRSDVNADGSVNSGDTTVVRGDRHVLPLGCREETLDRSLRQSQSKQARRRAGLKLFCHAAETFGEEWETVCVFGASPGMQSQNKASQPQ